MYIEVNTQKTVLQMIAMIWYNVH